MNTDTLRVLQVLKNLKEQGFQFRTCHEDAVPDASAGGLGEDAYLDLQCSLCFPIWTSDRSTDGGHSLSPAVGLRGTSSDPANDDRAHTTSTAEGEPASENAGECRVWKVLPARAALSLRLERLAPSRPPRPSRVPPVAPADSVCRLRLGVLGGGPVIRGSHPGALLSRDTLPESSTVMVGWNGYDASVGSPKEWPVEAPSARENSLSPSGESTELWLAVPHNGRSDLVLTLRVVAPERRRSAGKGCSGTGADAAATLGSVSIDWEGLSCLPVSGTDYFVETPSRKSLVRPAPIDLELLANVPPPSSSAATGSARGTNVCGRTSAPASLQMPATDGSIKPSNQGSRRTAGLYVRVSLQLETSPVSVPHVLSLSPIAARGPTAEAAENVVKGRPPHNIFSLGDFRDPCRKQRVPYLRFSWPWDDYWSALIERRNSPIAQKPWQHGSRRAVTWATKGVAAKGNVGEGTVSVRLPQKLSGVGESAEKVGINEDSSSGAADSALNARTQQCHHPPPVLFVEAYDMGPYAPVEHRAAMAVQRVWRRASTALRSAREWWEYYAILDRHNAAVRVQANYRGWKGRWRALVAKREAKVRGAAAAVVQRQWRCKRA